MESVKVQELKFKKVPVIEAQNFMCNYCGTTGFTYKWWRALVWVTKKVNFKILLCSDDCKKKFMESAKAQQFIDATIVKISAVHGENIEKVWEKK